MTQNSMDKIGMALSIGCAIHCVLTPIVLPLLPMLGFLIGHDGHFHLILSAVITGVAALALIPGYRKHKMWGPIISAWMGIVTIIVMGVLEYYTHSPLIMICTIIGSCFIIVGHYFNHKYLCKCEHHRCH